MPRPDYRDVDDYLKAQTPEGRPVLARVRATIRKALPGATEGISYQIPVYKVDGAMVLYFAAFKGHYSIYPATEALVAGLGKEGAARLQNKATLRFTYDEPFPARLITRIAKLRAAESKAYVAAKAKKKPTKKATMKPRTPAKRTKPAVRRRAG